MGGSRVTELRSRAEAAGVGGRELGLSVIGQRVQPSRRPQEGPVPRVVHKRRDGAESRDVPTAVGGGRGRVLVHFWACISQGPLAKLASFLLPTAVLCCPTLSVPAGLVQA